MSAGAIATPLIIPLRPPLLGTTSSHIDTNTFIEIRSDSSGVEIFYTTNGTKPDHVHKALNRTTQKYKRPFLLREGKRTIKAVAVSRNGLQESQLVTKTFQVDLAIPDVDHIQDPAEDDERNFQFAYHKAPYRSRSRSRSPPPMLTRPRSRSSSPIFRRSTDLNLDLHRLQLDERNVLTRTDSGFYSTGQVNGHTRESNSYPVHQTSSTQPYQSIHPPREYDFMNKQVVMAGDYPMRSSIAEPQYWVNGRPIKTQNTQVVPSGNVSWEHSLSLPLRTLDKQSIATQTSGLVFPTPEQLYRMRSEIEDLARVRQELKRLKEEQKPVLTDASIGKGFWQKQLTHITEHIKEFTTQNAEFRATVSEPRLTRIIGAAVEDEDDEYSVTFTFRKLPTPEYRSSRPCRQQYDKQGPKYFATRERGYYSDDCGSVYSIDSYETYEKPRKQIGGRAKKRNIPRPRKRHPSEERERSRERSYQEKMHPEDRLLLKEIGSKGKGRSEEVQQLLDEGANPNVENVDGVPVLAIAVINGLINCVPVLVEAGAKINKRFGARGNTALHEAVLKGPGAKKMIETLISNGANSQVQNNKGITPYDLAVKAGYDGITNMLASNVGFSLMDRLSKKYSNGDFKKHSSRRELDLDGF
ncbi:double zinc ribbon and ankyrin repeat-containing protein 1-like [Saccoglossus kowalevskii]|uniref:Double zinc ribbon and ankyrin repeat-containing protein 1-like n=1 Tax=Saccoglossus kowalevskii TaxID=10224 RepID=A0ABM0GP12_SACKO|nr:PREDICTED: double zinc ribbon and ankyrin repeat-containing protein 1-like [Saccoglossus kowalevskii]